MKIKNIELYKDKFYCPSCFTKRPYISLPISLKTAFYYIALFEGASLDYLVECQACKKAFDQKVLEPYKQNLIKLACAARNEMLLGVSPEAMKLKLISEGQKRDLADKLISLAKS